MHVSAKKLSGHERPIPGSQIQYDLAGRIRLLPVHWGTFDLAMHDWHQPAEVLLGKAPEGLVMPRLGEAIEPAHVEGVTPWWRAVAQSRKVTESAGLPPEAESTPG